MTSTYIGNGVYVSVVSSDKPTIPCPECGGDGTVWEASGTERDLCLTCRGEGRVNEWDIPSSAEIKRMWEELTNGG